MSGSRMRGDGTSGNDGGDRVPKPAATEVRAALERILKSRCFQQAGRASEFLRFVVEQTLAGAGQRLKGYTIGVEVFGRPADFDAQSDALVRVEAGRLRRRLVEYYASEGADDAVRIELPRGSYAVEYRFASADEWTAPPPQAPVIATPRDPFHWPLIAFGLGALLVAAVGVIAWQRSELRDLSRAIEAADDAPRTEWPRIVVVPFENLSTDRSLDAVAASMTEEIMVQLDELDLSVIASQARWYRPTREQNLEAAVAAGAYVLTGSVRASGTEARITARLIAARTGEQLWTAAYDEPLSIDRLSAVQERVAHDVAAIAAPYGPIFETELERARRSAGEPRLRDCLVTYHEYRRRADAAGYEETLACYLRVSGRQPSLPQVWSGLAMLYVDEYASSLGRAGVEALDAARAATAKALALDPNDFLANLALVRVQFFDGDEKFRRTIDRTLALRPRAAQAYAQAGFLLVITGDTELGLELTEKARSLTSKPLAFYHLIYAASYLRERRFSAALASALEVNAPNWVFAQAVLAAAAAHSGRHDIAREAAARIRHLYPQFETDALATFERWHFDQAYYDVFVSGLRAAGLVLKPPNVALSGG